VPKPSEKVFALMLCEPRTLASFPKANERVQLLKLRQGGEGATFNAHGHVSGGCLCLLQRAYGPPCVLTLGRQKAQALSPMRHWDRWSRRGADIGVDERRYKDTNIDGELRHCACALARPLYFYEMNYVLQRAREQVGGLPIAERSEQFLQRKKRWCYQIAASHGGVGAA
jgi:hypothetical protein